MACTVFLIIYVTVICYWIATDKQYSAATSETQFFVLSSLSLIVRVITMIFTWRVMDNFDKGLRSVEYNNIMCILVFDNRYD